MRGVPTVDAHGMRASLLGAICCLVLSNHSVLAASAPPHSCDYGVALAFDGRLAEAQAQFEDMLARDPNDASALVNLGNVKLLQGRREAALVFYDHAARGDTTDDGIQLNCATLLLLMGQDSLAYLTAAEATSKAGGRDAAAGLIGFTVSEELETSSKAADMSAAYHFPVVRREENGVVGGLVGGRLRGGVSTYVLADLSSRFAFALSHPAQRPRSKLTRRDQWGLLNPSNSARAHDRTVIADPTPSSAGIDKTVSVEGAPRGNNAAAMLYWKH